MSPDVWADCWQTASADETLALGEALGRSLVGGLSIALIGPLGAGKTQLVKGIARGNGVTDTRHVTSPTFTLVHEYAGRFRLFHVDAYRLAGPGDFLRLGPDEWLRPDCVVVIEWADRVRSALADDGLWVEFAITGDTARQLGVRAVGALAEQCLANLRLAAR